MAARVAVRQRATLPLFVLRRKFRGESTLHQAKRSHLFRRPEISFSEYLGASKGFNRFTFRDVFVRGSPPSPFVSKGMRCQWQND